MDKQPDIFNYYVGSLALLSAAISVLFYLRTSLPTARMKVLDELSRETRELYEKSCADGLLLATFLSRVERELIELEVGREELREQTYSAKTTVAQCIAFAKGLSTRIGRLSDCVKELRLLIVTTTERNRRARQAGNTITITLDVTPSTNLISQNVSDSCDITDYNAYSFLPATENIIVQSVPDSHKPSPLVTSNEHPPFGYPEPDSESITPTLVGRRRAFFSFCFWIRHWRRHRRDSKIPSSHVPDEPFDSGSLPV